MEMAENLLIELEGNIQIVTVNRPEKLNALNEATRRELGEVLESARNDEKVRVVIITGAGEKSFIAGADINEFAGRSAVEQRSVMNSRTGFSAADEFPKPIIAMINGFCLGGGCELALACDIRVASSNARFGQPEINLGIIPGGGGTQRLTRLIGEGRAMQMILTGEIIDAEEAKRIGLVNSIFPPEELRNETLKLAARIAEKSPIALEMAKTAVKNAARLNLKSGLQSEIDLFALCFSTADKEEGVRAFIEKRKPVFTGR